MNKIFKICLAVVIFLASGSVAWASLNYDSSNNYFLIDSILKTGGDYILVGDAFDEISNSFSVSNNLIFFFTSSERLSYLSNINFLLLSLRR